MHTQPAASKKPSAAAESHTKAWNHAEELSDAAGVPYYDRDGNKRNVGEPKDLRTIVLKQWCTMRMVEIT